MVSLFAGQEVDGSGFRAAGFKVWPPNEELTFSEIICPTVNATSQEQQAQHDSSHELRGN